MKTDLLASAPSLDALRLSIERFYCGMSCLIEGESVLRASDRKPCQGVRVVKKGKRYRFEMTYMERPS